MIERNDDFYTETLASLYRKHGYAEKALACYKIIFKKKPDSEHINTLISDLESETSGHFNSHKEDLSNLFIEWLKLLSHTQTIK